MTQISAEEALSLRLAMKGLSTYAETLSVYGTIPSFLDGDDTPWSKAFWLPPTRLEALSHALLQAHARKR